MKDISSGPFFSGLGGLDVRGVPPQRPREVGPGEGGTDSRGPRIRRHTGMDKLCFTNDTIILINFSFFVVEMVKYIIVIYGYKYGFFQVDDGEYFQTLPENSVFIFLRSGEIWRPEGTDAVRAGKQKKCRK